jgi:hypothetical protein
MKKIWMFLLVALLATGLVFVSCGDNGNGNGEEGELIWSAPVNTVVDLSCEGDDDGAVVYQNPWEASGLFQGARISKDQKFTLSVTFKLDRDADNIVFGFLDTTSGAWEDHWGPLTDWDGDFGEPQGNLDEPIAANTEITKVFHFTATHAASANGAAANALYVSVERAADNCTACHWWSCIPCGFDLAGNSWLNNQRDNWCPCDDDAGSVNSAACQAACDCDNAPVKVTFVELEIFAGHIEP